MRKNGKESGGGEGVDFLSYIFTSVVFSEVTVRGIRSRKGKEVNKEIKRNLTKKQKRVEQMGRSSGKVEVKRKTWLKRSRGEEVKMNGKSKEG